MFFLKALTSNSNIQLLKLACRQKSTIGFIGLGNMGGSMAINLAKNGHDVHIYDSQVKTVEAIQHRASKYPLKVIKKPLDITEVPNLKTIVTMLPNSHIVNQVYGVANEDHGLLRNIKPGTLCIDCTTGDISAAHNLNRLIASKKAQFVDAPVSGGVMAARDATLTFMVGGNAADVKNSTEVLEAMGKKIFHCGDVGTGLAAKICNNMLLAISMIGTSEAMSLGTRLGLEPKILATILNSSSGRCWSSEIYNPVPGVLEGVPASKDYVGGFGTALMAKDLGLAQSASTQTRTPVPLGSLSHQIYRMMCQQGFSNKDFSSVFAFLNEVKK